MRTGHLGSMADLGWAAAVVLRQPSMMPMHSQPWATERPSSLRAAWKSGQKQLLVFIAVAFQSVWSTSVG